MRCQITCQGHCKNTFVSQVIFSQVISALISTAGINIPNVRNKVKALSNKTLLFIKERIKDEHNRKCIVLMGSRIKAITR